MTTAQWLEELQLLVLKRTHGSKQPLRTVETMSLKIAMRFFAVVLSSVVPLTAESLLAEEGVDFNRDVRPVLSSKCYPCHGPDESHREADLRLDVRSEAIDFGAIVPGDAADSEIIRRVLSDDPEEIMPPPQANDSLTSEEKATLRRWVDSGADYQKHWSFVRPSRPDVPNVEAANWAKNAVDHFVLSRLDREGLAPSPEAGAYALVRRVYLDLIGLPPTPEQVEAFVRDDSPRAYEQLVDDLLASEHYGEHWARQWLDLARYSDTNGYEKDRERSIWPYRDWVIKALNADMPFDQFSIEQLAGDMLPNPTQDQLVATGFHRNTMLNEEGGIDPLEYRFYSVVDRVATTGTVWLGLSTGCAQCHTHKYDPITHTDYYSLFGLLNNADEPDLLLKTPDVLARRTNTLEQIGELESKLAAQFPMPVEAESKDTATENTDVEASSAAVAIDAERRQDNLETHFSDWLDENRKASRRWTTITPTDMETNSARLEVLGDGSIFSTGDITKRDTFKLRFDVTKLALPITAVRLEVLPDERLPAGGPGRAYYEGRKGDFFLSEVDARLDAVDVSLVSASHSHGKISVGSGSADASGVLDGDGSTGWSTAKQEGKANQIVLNFDSAIAGGSVLEIELLFERHFAASLGRFRFSVCQSDKPVVASQLPVEIEAQLADGDSLSDSERDGLLRYYLSVAPELAEARKPIDALRGSLPPFPSTLIFEERIADNPRTTHRHHRGEYLSPKEVVTAAVPEFLREGRGPTNRLDLARWLVSEDNPLVGRVTVNRAWQAIFGVGLQRSSDDFGTQAGLPTHPELLDWLACEFVDNGWSMKHIHRTLVTSAAYRQSSIVTQRLLERDPDNELLARGPRFRVPAEGVRDMLLASSGLLSEAKFGPGVRPPQPQIVTGVAYGSPKWEVSEGEQRYRRSIYTFRKRTAPFAAFATFDATSGENCTARRDRSNTPLQALTLLNDAMFLEMAQSIGQEAFDQLVPPAETVQFLFRRILSRPAEEAEVIAILSFYESQLARFAAGEISMKDVGGQAGTTPESAAWVTVARSIMNLDEAITKQ